MKPEIIVSLIGSLISALGAIIVALIQTRAKKIEKPPQLIIPEGYKDNHSRFSKTLLLLLSISILGGVVSYFSFLWINNSHQLKIPLTPSKLPETQTKSPSLENQSIITGQILWNDQPLEDISIVLFRDGNAYFLTYTDSLGYFEFRKLESDNYSIGVNGWAEDEKYIYNGRNPLFSTAASPYSFSVEKGEVIEENFNLTKTDLVILAPSEHSSVVEEPIFSWEKYPEASYYVIRIYKWDDRTHTYPTVYYKRTIYTKHELSQPLEKGISYSAIITAYNSNEAPIAEQDISDFTVDR